MADEHYARFAEDHEPGETVTLIGEDIRQFAELCFRVMKRLEDSLMPGAALSPAYHCSLPISVIARADGGRCVFQSVYQVIVHRASSGGWDVVASVNMTARNTAQPAAKP